MAKVRLDELVNAKQRYPTLKEARAAILAGEVKVDGVPISQTGALVEEGAHVECAPEKRFVSRGGEKLERALKLFDIDVKGTSCIDVGASSGGFTDCLLKHGAAQVVAVDVGYGQLDWALRSDTRVEVFERTNIRAVDPASLGAPFDVLVCDVSFISLTKLMGIFSRLISDEGVGIVLVKPQFEARKAELGTHGVVTDPAVSKRVISEVVESASAAGLFARDLTYSPIRGPKGNREFLLVLTKQSCATLAGGRLPDTASATIEGVIEGVVDEAYEVLEGSQ